jgi:hypothetical protein
MHKYETAANQKHKVLCQKLDQKFKTYDTALETAKASTENNAMQIAELREMILKQNATIEALSAKVDENNQKMTDDILEILQLCNSVEGHQRRWAIRILGLKAPDEAGESTYAAKQLVLGFIQEHLHVDNVVIEDIDCAHRVGRVVDFKQTLLVRFFARDLVQLLLRNKTNSKAHSS